MAALRCSVARCGAFVAFNAANIQNISEMQSVRGKKIAFPSYSFFTLPHCRHGMVAGWQSCHSGRWQLPCAPPRLAGMWVPLCRRPGSGSLMLPRGVRPVALQASDVVRKRQRRHCGGCFCAAFRYSARPVRWRAPAGILLLHLSRMLVARGVWPCRRGCLVLQYGPFGPVIRAVSYGHTGRVFNLLCARWLRNGAPPWR